MNFSKIAFSLITLSIVSVLVPKNVIETQASGATVLRFAQDDLGASGQSLSDFNIQGSSVTVTKNANKGIVMTTGGSQASSVFLKEQLAADAASPGFSTYFVMNVYKLTPGPADGYVFVIAANSNSLGALGGGLGYSGITNSVGIEFDFYDNGGESMASSDVFTNGNPSSTAGTVFDAGYLSRWSSVSSGALVRAFHTWIEYDHTRSKLELRVATSNNESPSNIRPARPASALLTRSASYSQISNFFYAGFTAATGGQMQQMSLKSWYLSNAYIPNGINPDSTQIVVDNTPPTAPAIQTTFANNQYALSVSGGTDDSGIAGYQYKLPSGNWQNYGAPVAMTTVGEYQARTVDQAGNYSTTVTSIWLYQIHFSAGGTVRQSVYRVSTDAAFAIDYEYFDGTYLYQDWYLTNGFTGEPLTSIATRTTSITIFGKPIQNVFTVGYVLNGGYVSIANPTFYVINTSLVLTEPSKEGHTFAGWFLNESLTLAYNPDQIPTNNFILYASYNTNVYTLAITLNDDAKTTSSISLPYQTNLDLTLQSLEDDIETQTYAKLGHQFDGWFINEGLTTPYIESSTIQGDTTIYGKWAIQSYLVTYQLPNAETYITQEVIYESPIQFPTDPTLAGHTFVGWIQGEQLFANGSPMKANPLTLTASFSKNSYGLTFQTNQDTTIEGLTLPYETALAEYLPSNLLKDGHTFDGWYLDDAFIQPLAAQAVLTQTTTLYAKWNINDYTLTYQTNGGSSISNRTITFNDPIVLPGDPTQEGYTFTGWFEDETLVDSALPLTMPSRDVTLYAGWQINIYDLYFHPGHGLNMDDIQYEFNQTLDPLPTPSLEGYTFIGWFVDELLTEPYAFERMPSRQVNIYAKWAINTYVLDFNTNGGDVIASSPVTYQEAIVLPNDPVKEGYTFNGWYTDENLLTSYQPQTMPARDVTLHARWTINQYQVHFNLNNNSSSTSSTYTYQQVMPTFAIPFKEGHTFMGWFIDADLNEPLAMETMPAHDIQLYAKWDINTYELTFGADHLNQPILSTTVVYGQSPLLPVPPTREGYDFLGWSVDGVLVSEGWTMPSNDVELTAVWEGLSGQAVLITPDHTTILTTTSGVAIGTLPTLSIKPGYVFLGWSLTMGDASKIIDETYVVANGLTIKLYPIWEKTTNPVVLLNQYLALGFEQVESYTYEIIVFTTLMGMAVVGLLVYRKRVTYGA